MTNFVEHTLAFANGKGGVGKTSMSSNCGGLAAAAGWRVLVADFDPQGNLSEDLGLEQDNGNALLTSLMTGTPVPIIKNVRTNLDVVPGGRALADITNVLAGRAARMEDPSQRPDTFGDLLHASLSPIASDYDLIVFDLPPGYPAIINGTLECTRALVIPTRADSASIGGLQAVAEAFTVARKTNPSLRLAGVALFQIGSRSKRLEEAVRDRVTEMIGAAAPVFATRIRHLETAAYDLRDKGLLAHELESEAANAQVSRLAALRAGKKPVDEYLARSASGLAEDYEQLTMEIFARMSEFDAEQEVVA
ncbi:MULTISPECIES: ParA family protein [Rhodococcus]|uniref:ParA family protein n=1 Tax=Rhodococcus pseudokoreensis TaxID=2811421 RepID=A0A974VYP9_9NOCA|nr:MULTISPECIES: ParA family protein [Rhodococcus]MDV6246243.1 ParA family protein [Rhodococcus opacus]QSE87138.1 ParA family protein [Rhodococcus pseudokoreensis]